MYSTAINGLSCYKCSWTDKTCNAETLASGTPKEECNPFAGGGTGTTTAAADSGSSNPAEVTTGNPAADASAAPPAAVRSKNRRSIWDSTQDADGVHRTMRSKPFLSKMADSPTYHCFQVHVKASEYMNTCECAFPHDSQTSFLGCTR